MVVDQTSYTYDLYLNTGAADATTTDKLNARSMAFRNGTTDPLSMIMALAGAAPIDNGVEYDDLVLLSGVDLTNPLGSTPMTYLGESESLTVEGDCTLAATAVLELDIATPSILDLLDVAGHLSAAGTLAVTLVDGAPAPSLGDMFDIFDFASASGAFDTLDLPGLASGLAWKSSDLLTSGILAVVADGVIGDYNQDGIVDAADYTVWRNNLGGDGSVLPNRDPANSGVVSTDDYDSWRSHYGEISGTGSLLGSSSAVPEPAALWLALLAICGVPLVRRHRGGTQ